MKVIKSRLLTADWPKRCVCEGCGAELEYVLEDMYIGWMGVEYVTCPECGQEAYIGGERKVKPTWPLTFLHTCKNKDIKELNEEVVNEMVDKVVEAMQNSKEDWDFTMKASGDTMVVGWKNADGINIYVTKDYWEDNIASKDYGMIK